MEEIRPIEFEIGLLVTITDVQCGQLGKGLEMSMNDAYCSPPPTPTVARAASWHRLTRAWVDGTLRRAEERRERNRILRDPDAAWSEATSTAAVEAVLRPRGYFVRDGHLTTSATRRPDDDHGLTYGVTWGGS